MLDWNNDDLFFTYEFEDETSMFDDHPSKRWAGGLDCYMRTYKCRVPIAFQDSEEMIDKFICMMEDSGDEGFWV